MTVYTAIFGGYDRLMIPWVSQTEKGFCLTDSEEVSGYWKKMSAKVPDMDLCRKARWAKTHSHILFPDDEITIWIDGSVRLRVDIGEIAKELLGDADVAMFRHSVRRCIYQEANACIEFKKDCPEIIEKQMASYRKIGFPENYGLVASGIVIRRNCEEVAEMNEMWWGEIGSWSKRDQLSFDFCRWATGVKFKELPGSIYDGRMCDLDRYHKRKK